MKKVTLTFDNGPMVGTTPGVLAELKQRQLKAYFCVVGTQLSDEVHVDLARESLEMGHRLVNHSLTHEIPLGDNPTLEHAKSEITKMHELMTQKLGDWGDRWFRPFGRGGQIGPHVFSEAALQEFERLNYSILLWNSIPRDWEDPDGWVTTALKQIADQDHTVVVLHDIDTGAMKHLPMFLDELEMREIEITLNLPDTCVPFRNGEPTISKKALHKLVS